MRTASKSSINGIKEATFFKSQAMGNLFLANWNLTHYVLENILGEVIKKETSAKTFEFGLVLKNRNPKLDFCLKSFQDWLTINNPGITWKMAWYASSYSTFKIWNENKDDRKTNNAKIQHKKDISALAASTAKFMHLMNK